MPPVVSRLLARLDAASARTRNPVELACLKAERAGFLGRHGQVETAKQQLQEIQRQFARQPHVAVSGWLALAEGQLDHYSRLSSSAHDRFQRAYALSTAAQLKPLQALSAAWLAHACDVRNDRLRTAQLVAEALRLAADDDHGARWRACLTVGTGYHFCGRLDLGLPWYAAARRHALADGDEVALSAVIYNQAGMRSDQARRAAAFGSADGSQQLHAVMGTESTIHFDAAIGLLSLDWLVPLMRAQLLVVENRFTEALELFEQHGDRAEEVWRERMEPCLYADRAWCLLKTGREAEAREEARFAVQAMADSPCDLDDRAVAHARLAQLFDAFGEPEKAALHQAAALADHAAFSAQQEAWLGMLNEALAGLSPV